jgi:hypothetical protein
MKRAFHRTKKMLLAKSFFQEGGEKVRGILTFIQLFHFFPWGIKMTILFLPELPGIKTIGISLKKNI